MDGLASKPPGRSSPAKSSAVENPSTVMDSLSKEWTDEKHCSYLNSMEASFVNQLYGSEYLSGDLICWLSRTQKKINPPDAKPSKQTFGQFKVLRQGCWDKVNFDRAKNKVNIENVSRHLLANPWVQHFRSPVIEKHPQLSSEIVDGNVLTSRSTNSSSPNGAKKTVAKQLTACYSRTFHRNCIDSRAEVSDQNFVDKECEGLEQPSKNCSKKRVRGASYSLISDQIVPSEASSASSFLRNFVHKNEIDAEFSSNMIPQDISGPSYYNEKDPEDLRFKNG